MKAIVLLIAALAVAAASVGCGSAPSRPANNLPTPAPGEETASAVRVLSVAMYRDDGSGLPGEEVTVFAPGDHTMHFEARTAGLRTGQNVKLLFTAVDTANGRDYPVAEAETGELLIANEITGQVSLDKDWPVGDYRLDIFVDGGKVYSWDYQVEE